MNATAQCLQMLDTVYHGALRFITNYRSLTHRCTLYSKVNWPSLSTRRLSHWHVFIYKAIIGYLPGYLSCLLIRKESSYELRSQDLLLMTTSKFDSDLGKKAFGVSAPDAWNTLQEDLMLQDAVTLGEFKELIKTRESETIGICKCFD